MLVFEEAFSSIDSYTKRGIIDGVYRLSGEKTVIMTAHRTKTLERCDRIFEIEKVRRTDIVSYSSLTEAHLSREAARTKES